MSVASGGLPLVLSVCSKGASMGTIKKIYWEYKLLDVFVI